LQNLHTTSNFVSAIDVKYDELKERFIGSFSSLRGEYRLEAVNMADLMQSIELILRDEYLSIQRELNSRSQEISRGRGGGGGGNRREAGQQIYTIDSARGVTASNLKWKSVKNWANYIKTGASLAAGNYFESGFVAFSLMLTDMYEGVESLWDKPKNKQIFAAVFGGVLITANSRHELRKKLWRQKNLRIHHIMMHIREAGLIKGDPHNLLEEKKAKDDKKSRLRNKKRRAQIQLTTNWVRRVCPQGQGTGWRDRSLNLRSRLEAKKDLSKDLLYNQHI
jgi:hypothetical protein